MVLESIGIEKVYTDLNSKLFDVLDSKQYAVCVSRYYVGCKYKNWRLKPVKKRLKMLMLNGWNQIAFKVIWSGGYKFIIDENNVIKHRSFIPWNTTLPNACAMRDQYVTQHLNRVKYFELDMDYTYGQMYGLNTVIACFNEIASENNVKVTIHGTYTKKYMIAKFEVKGGLRAKNMFYTLLVDRTKSAKCIEYICIYWNGLTYTKTNTSANITTNNRSNSKCTADTAIVMAYPHSIDMIKVQLTTNNTDSYMHLTTCLQEILKDQYKLISVNKASKSNDTAVIYIKLGSVAATVVKRVWITVTHLYC